MWALRTALEQLEKYYRDVREPPNRRVRYFPLATEYRKDGRTVKFEYTDFLKSPGESCVAFLARECDDPARTIVVKFVERYGEAAHRLLAEKGLAPVLLYYGGICQHSEPERHGCGTRKMVVMEYVEGVVAEDLLDSVSGDSATRIRQGVHAAVRRAVGLLQAHTPPLVHGDLRLPNIVIAECQEGGDEDVEGRVRIVDFDWAGVAGEVRYPLHLSTAIKWPAGVADYAPITTAHDDDMVAKLAN